MSNKGLQEHLRHHKMTDRDHNGKIYWKWNDTYPLNAALLTHYGWHIYVGPAYKPDHNHRGLKL